MHMADALLSPAVGGIMCAVSAGALAYSTIKIKKDELGEKKVPVMGVMGAFVFAAQMINFTIPATGSSGHIGGGILLAAMLGASPSFLTIAAVLIIQALFFADGGLLALGCNIFNMGIIPCLIIYPLIFRPILKRGINIKTISLASILSVIISLQLGAFSVVLETLFSGITELPFTTFIALMQPIHLAIGAVEGIVTAAVLVFVYKMRPELLQSATTHTKLPSVSLKKLIITLSVITLVVAGGISLLASANPDGLEWAIGKTAGTEELEASGQVHQDAAALQADTAFMPDYDYKDGSGSGTSTAGIVGALITFAVAGAAGAVITLVKKRKKTADEGGTAD